MTQMTKQEVLTSLKMDNFQHMTPAQEIALANMAQRMPSDVLEAVLQEVPNLSSTVRAILSVCVQQSEKIFASDEARMRHFRNLCDNTLASLQNMGNKADSQEERLKISEKMMEIIRLVDKANERQIQVQERERERSDKILKGVAVAGGTVAVIGLIYVLCKAFSNDRSDDGSYKALSGRDSELIDMRHIEEESDRRRFIEPPRYD